MPYADICTDDRLHRYGGIWPITTSPTGDPIEQVNIGGYNWDLYFGYNGAMKVYSFLPSGDNAIYSFNGDIKHYFNHLTRNHEFPENNQYMLSETPTVPRLFSVLATNKPK